MDNGFHKTESAYSAEEIAELRRALEADIGQPVTTTDNEIRMMADETINLLRVVTRIVVAQHKRRLPWPYETGSTS